MQETDLAGLVNMEETRHSTKHRYNLKTRFDIVKSLGHGTYGKVKLAIDKKTGQKVSLDCILNFVFAWNIEMER